MTAKRKDDVALLTPDEAAEQLRVSVRQLHRLRRLGLVRGIKLGHRTIVYEEPEIRDFILKRRQAGSTRPQRQLFTADDNAMPTRF